MKLLKIIEELYVNNSKQQNLAKSITLSNSLMYLTLCAENFKIKATSPRSNKYEKRLYSYLINDINTILESYHELLNDLLGEELSVDMGTYYKINLSDGFDQIIYKAKTDKEHVKYTSNNLLTILNAIYLKLSDRTIDMVIRDNKNYKTLVTWLNDLVNHLEEGLDRISELVNISPSEQ